MTAATTSNFTDHSLRKAQGLRVDFGTIAAMAATLPPSALRDQGVIRAYEASILLDGTITEFPAQTGALLLPLLKQTNIQTLATSQTAKERNERLQGAFSNLSAAASLYLDAPDSHTCKTLLKLSQQLLQA
jgi:hypothetical protein